MSSRSSRRAARGGCPGSPRRRTPCRRRRTAPRGRGTTASSRVRVHGPAGLVARNSCVVCAVDVAEDVERAVVIAEARRPDALAVDLLAVFETERRAEVEPVERVGDEAASSPGRASAASAGPACCASSCRSGSSRRRRGSGRGRRTRRRRADSRTCRCRCPLSRCHAGRPRKRTTARAGRRQRIESRVGK